ncbi:hypothetical protein HPB49_023679 [Dermacentor silvarum]|uniref:Uncharacterized protein n=1 Tax=Dermacentor silvarum TaxID=543639 RepID=A0ACB8DLH1_DERSI|nr:hypothetical protein HPB49_023679 [Dermacentor silvarum]
MAAMANGQSNNKAGANRVYFALKDDVALLTEVQTSDPFRHSEQWEEIAWRLRDVLKKPFTAGCVRERLNLLLSRYSANDRRNKKKSGTEEEYTERDQLLQDILSLIQGTSYKVRSAKKSRKVCSGDSNVQARKSAAAARDVHASRYAERSTVFIDECDTADDEFDIASPTGDVTPAQLLTRMVTADDYDGEREDDISESAMSIRFLQSFNRLQLPMQCLVPEIPYMRRLSQQRGVGAPNHLGTNRRVLKPHQATPGAEKDNKNRQTTTFC